MDQVPSMSEPMAPEFPQLAIAAETKTSKREQRKRAKRKKIIISVVVVIVLVVTGVAWSVYSAASKADGTVEPGIETVYVGDFSRTVTGKGKLRPLSSSLVNSQVPGTVEQLFVQEGDRVVVGDKLFSVKNDDLDELVSDAASALSIAQRGVADAVRANSAAQADLAAVRRAYNDASAAYNAATDPAAQPEARAALEAASAQVRAAEAAISAADSATVAAEGQSATANRALEKARKQADLRTVVATMDGVILAVSVSQGGPVAAGDMAASAGATTLPAVEIADMSALVVRVSVNEMDIASIVVGQTALVTFDAVAGLEATGTVVRIAPKSSAESSGVDMGVVTGETGQVVTYDVDVRIDAPDARLRSGMTAQTLVSITKQTGVLLLNPMCIIYEGTETYVDVYTGMGKEPERRTVVLGESTDSMTIVLEGLKEGDKVLNSSGPAPSDALPDAAASVAPAKG